MLFASSGVVIHGMVKVLQYFCLSGAHDFGFLGIWLPSAIVLLYTDVHRPVCAASCTITRSEKCAALACALPKVMSSNAVAVSIFLLFTLSPLLFMFAVNACYFSLINP